MWVRVSFWLVCYAFHEILCIIDPIKSMDLVVMYIAILCGGI